MSLLDFSLRGSDPTTPNAFIQTPQQVAARRQTADATLLGGSDTSPVQSRWQGAAVWAKLWRPLTAYVTF